MATREPSELAPYDRTLRIDPEVSVLGGIIMQPEMLKKLSSALDPAYFNRRAHRLICTAILALSRRSDPIDITTVVDELGAMRVLEQVGGVVYVADLQSSVSTTANIEHHAELPSCLHIAANHAALVLCSLGDARFGCWDIPLEAL